MARLVPTVHLGCSESDTQKHLLESCLGNVHRSSGNLSAIGGKWMLSGPPALFALPAALANAKRSGPAADG